MEQLRKFCKETIKKYPSIATEVWELYELCQTEIEDGESQTEEINKCIYSIEELIDEL